MKSFLIATISAAALFAAGTGTAFAKGHDMGVADGSQTPVANDFDNTGQFIQSNREDFETGNRVKDLVKGKRGTVASTAKSGNATDPQVGNGANTEPD